MTLRARAQQKAYSELQRRYPEEWQVLYGKEQAILLPPPGPGSPKGRDRNRLHSKAQTRAQLRLAHAHPAEYRALYRAWVVALGGKVFEPARCGTTSGYQRHLREGGWACEDCLQATRDAARRAYVPKERTHVPCGTWGAYMRHRRAGEKPCRECLDGVNRRNKERIAERRRAS